MSLETIAVGDPIKELIDRKDLVLTDRYKKVDESLFKGIGFGCPSFCGKIYNESIQKITCQGLYQEYINPKRVKKMYARIVSYYSKHPEEQWLEFFVKWFKICAENNYGLVGWW
jgi:hypothetical protein